MTTLAKSNKLNNKQSIAIICSSFKNKTEYGFTKEQIDYINTQIKAESKRLLPLTRYLTL